MIAHFFGLIAQAIVKTPEPIGYTWGGILFTVVIVGITQFALWRFGEQRGHWRQRKTVVGFLVVVLAWTVLFLSSMIRCVYDDHQNMVAAAVRIKRSLHDEIRSERSALNSKIADDRVQLNQKDVALGVAHGRNETLLTQNRDQQNTINSYVVAIAKNVAERALAFTVRAASTPLANSNGHMVALLVQPNEAVASPNIKLNCSGPYKLIYASYSGRLGMMDISNEIWRQQDNNNVIYSRSTPVWAANEPVIFYVIVGKNGDVGTCSVVQQ